MLKAMLFSHGNLPKSIQIYPNPTIGGVWWIHEVSWSISWWCQSFSNAETLLGPSCPSQSAKLLGYDGTISLLWLYHVFTPKQP